MYRQNRMKRTKLKQARAHLTGYQNQCPVCSELFETTEAFDAHRVGPIDARQCLNTGAMRAAGMIRSPAGLWDIGPDADRAALEAEQAEA